jgi:hypothetical protein
MTLMTIEPILTHFDGLFLYLYVNLQCGIRAPEGSRRNAETVAACPRS